MDPNWNNFGQYGRLAAGAGLPTNTGMNLYDRSILEQAAPGLGTTGLVSPPLPAHSSLPAQRLAALPSVGYGHTLHGSLIDPIASLSQSLSQSPYKTVAVGQPPFTLEATPTKSHLEPNTAARFFTTPGDPPPLVKDETASVSYPASTTTSLSAVDVAAYAAHINSQIQQVSSAATAPSFSVDLPAPPPAHSGPVASSRASTIQRTPYPPTQTVKTEYAPSNKSSVQSTAPIDTIHPAFGSVTRVYPETASRIYQEPEVRSTPPAAHKPPAAHQNQPTYSAPTPTTPQPVASYVESREPQRVSTEPARNVRQTYTDPPHVQQQSLGGRSSSSLLQQQQQQQYSYGSPVTPVTTATVSIGYSASSMYDPVSPPPPQSEPQQQQQPQQQYLSLQDLAEMSATHEKLPVNEPPPQMQSPPAVAPPSRQSLIPQSSPQTHQTLIQKAQPPTQTLSHRSAPSPQAMSQPLSHKSAPSPQAMQQPLTHKSAPSPQAMQPPLTHKSAPSPQAMQPAVQKSAPSGVPRHMQALQQHSPVPTSPHGHTVNSPQLSTSPQHQHQSHLQQTVASHAALNMQQPVPIQAVADSTTKPKGKGRSRKKQPKKVEEPHVEPPIPSEQFMTLDATAISSIQSPLKNKGKKGSLKNRVQASPPPTSMTQLDPAVVSPQIQCYSAMQAAPYGGTYVLPGDQLHGEGGPAPITSQPEPGEVTYMSNTFGSSFVNPNDILNEQRIAPQTLVSALESEDSKEGILMQEDSYDKPRQRTKAQQKEMPPPKEEVDEEFAHLTTPPKASPSKPTVKTEPKPTGFMDSFMSFLQGNKAETLSSVTNSTISKRPEMPKYVPDPRPRRVPTPEPLRHPNPHIHGKPKAPIISFSDDEEEGDTFKSTHKTVMSVISNLDDEKGNTGPKNVNKVVPPIIIKTVRPKKTPKAQTTPKAPKQKAEPKIKPQDVLPLREKSSRKAKDKIEEKRRKKQEKRKRKHSKTKIAWDDSESSDTEGQEYVELSSDDSHKGYDSDKDPEWSAFGSAEGPKPGAGGVGVGGRRGGPPLMQSVMQGLSSGSDDEAAFSQPKKAKKTPRRASGGRGRGIRYTDESAEKRSVRDEPLPPEFSRGSYVLDKQDLTKDKHPIWKIDAGRLLQKYEPVMSEGKACHRAMSTYSSWSSNIKEQFIPIKVRRILVERGSEIVEVIPESKPAPEPEPASKPEQEQAQETAEVPAQPEPAAEPTAPVTAPAPAPHTSEPASEEPLLVPFNVYLQILISQALVPSFLSAITQQQDEYYCGPLKQIDSLVEEHREKHRCPLPWSSEFQMIADVYPECTVRQTPGLEGPCQACPESGENIAGCVTFSGCPYNRITLIEEGGRSSKEFLIGPTTMNCLQRYHRLHHLKRHLYTQCLEQIEKLKDIATDSSDILDHCLQNRDWVLRLFEFLKSSLEGTQHPS